MFNISELSGSLPIPPDALRIVHAAGINLVADINVRVLDGIGLDDSPMTYKGKVYSEKYKKFRQGANPKKKSRQVTKRDLTWSGRMLEGVHALKPEMIDESTARCIVTVTQKQMLKALGQHEMTPWFGPSPKDLEAMKEQVEEMLAELTNK